MNPNIIKPVNVIKKFKIKFLLARKFTPIDEFCFNTLESCFSYGIVIWWTLFTYGSFNAEGL